MFSISLWRRRQMASALRFSSHAVFQQATAPGLHLIHATSDDGANWQSGALLTEDTGISDPCVAIASDHVGVVVWHTRTATGPQIRVTALGPTAPVTPDPVLPVTPVLPGPPARRQGEGHRRGQARRPRGCQRGAGMPGQAHRPNPPRQEAGGQAQGDREATCRYRTALTLGRRNVKRARRLAMTLRFGGNDLIAPLSRTYKLKIRR
jgi:hypothetical protein